MAKSRQSKTKPAQVQTRCGLRERREFLDHQGIKVISDACDRFLRSRGLPTTSFNKLKLNVFENT
jgi:hypothetical protein